MSNTKTSPNQISRFDRPSENHITINTGHAPWHHDKGRNANDTSQHRRYHSLFKDLMN